MFENKTFMSALAFALALAVIGCSDDNGTSATPMSMGEVRVAHLSPDAPNVDVAVDGEVILSNVPYEAISEYQSPPGHTP